MGRETEPSLQECVRRMIAVITSEADQDGCDIEIVNRVNRHLEEIAQDDSPLLDIYSGIVAASAFISFLGIEHLAEKIMALAVEFNETITDMRDKLIERDGE